MSDKQAPGPRDEAGHFISRKCDVCGCGTLQPQDGGWWTCDGLIDPEHPDLPLDACHVAHRDGDATGAQP